MYKIFDMDGTVYKTLTVGYNLLLLNILVFITSIPLVTYGVSITAAFSVLEEHNNGEIMIPIKRYFHFFKERFNKSFQLSLIQIILIILSMALLAILEIVPILQVVMLLVFSLLLLVTSLFFQVSAHFYEYDLKAIISMSAIMSLKDTLIVVLYFLAPVVSILIPIFLPKIVFPYILVVISLPIYIQQYILAVPLSRIYEKQKENNQ